MSSLYAIGQAVYKKGAFADASGNPVDPNPVAVTLLIIATNTTTVYQYPPRSGFPQDSQLVRLGPGSYQLGISPTVASPYKGTFAAPGSPVGASQPFGFTVIDPLSLAYPYAFGYCDVLDVQANITAGTWDPTKPGASPDLGRAQQLINNAAAQIDTVLAHRGYTIPIQQVLGGPAVGPQAWSLLREINAALATAQVERERFGSQGEQASDAGYWQTYADDLLVRLDNGDDILTQFGVAQQGWAPVADPSASISFGATEANPDGSVPYALFSVEDAW